MLLTLFYVGFTYRVKHDLLSSIYEYTGQSDILEKITNRRRRSVAQSLCNHNSLIQYFASVIAQFSVFLFFSVYICHLCLCYWSYQWINDAITKIKKPTVYSWDAGVGADLAAVQTARWRWVFVFQRPRSTSPDRAATEWDAAPAPQLPYPTVPSTLPPSPLQPRGSGTDEPRREHALDARRPAGPWRRSPWAVVGWERCDRRRDRRRRDERTTFPVRPNATYTHDTFIHSFSFICQSLCSDSMLSFCMTAFHQARTSGHQWNSFYYFHLAFNPRDLYYRGYKFLN